MVLTSACAGYLRAITGSDYSGCFVSYSVVLFFSSFKSYLKLLFLGHVALVCV